MPFKHFLLSLSCFAVALFGNSQPPQGHGYAQVSKSGAALIVGQLIDSSNQVPISYATLSVFSAKDNRLLTGTITNDKGKYEVKEVPTGIPLVLKAAFVGYKESTVKLTIPRGQSIYNVPEISMASDNVLDELVVDGEKPALRYEMDKKIIDVANQQTSAGQTATELLSSTPAVTTDVDGNVTLRGGGFTLLIDGKLSPLDPTDALNAIPANNIEEIEIITNPSAKYDAEGTGGIINIITKKKKLEGISVLSNAHVGTFENYGGDVSFSAGKERWLLNVSANGNSRERPRDIEKVRTTTTDSGVGVIKSNGEGAWHVNSWGGSADLQWTPSDRHLLSVAGSYQRLNMVPYFYLNFEEFDNDTLTRAYLNKQNNLIDIRGTSLSLFYQYFIGGSRRHKITMKAIQNKRDVEQLDSVSYFGTDGAYQGGTKYSEVGPSDFVRFNVDYEQPIGKLKLETGAQAQLGMSADAGESFFYDEATQSFFVVDSLSSDVSYERDIYAGYFTIGGSAGKLDFQGGLRVEYTHRTVESNNFRDFIAINRMDWFPSAHFTYDLGEGQQLLVNYSRRIWRPRSWYFEPFVTWETAFNVRSGNPDLVPEYINNFELSWMKPLKDRNTISVDTYFKRTNGVINRVSSVYQEDVIITRPFNTGVALSYGIEPSLQYRLKPWWQLQAFANLFFYDISGVVEGVDYARSSTNLITRLQNKFDFGNNWSTQLVGRYTAPTVTPQGDQKGFVVVDASVRKTWQDGRYTAVLRGSNVLGTQVDNHTIINQNLHLNRINTPKFPLVSVVFTAKLNNYKKVMQRHAAADEF